MYLDTALRIARGVAGAGIVPAVHGLPERAVGDGEHEADNQEGENKDEAHPRERNEGCEEPAGLVDVAPRQVAPVGLRGVCQTLQHGCREMVRRTVAMAAPTSHITKRTKRPIVSPRKVDTRP